MQHYKAQIYSDELMAAALAAAPRGCHRVPAAAKAIGCASKTVRKYLKRKRSRKKRMFPAAAEIELALYRLNGSAVASARLLGCTEDYIVRYIHAERAKGREIGRRGAGRRKSDFLPPHALVFTAPEMSVDHPDGQEILQARSGGDAGVRRVVPSNAARLRDRSVMSEPISTAQMRRLHAIGKLVGRNLEDIRDEAAANWAPTPVTRFNFAGLPKRIAASTAQAVSKPASAPITTKPMSLDRRLSCGAPELDSIPW